MITYHASLHHRGHFCVWQPAAAAFFLETGVGSYSRYLGPGQPGKIDGGVVRGKSA